LRNVLGWLGCFPEHTLLLSRHDKALKKFLIQNKLLKFLLQRV
jgi:hypothetical protein